jgi:hypothetical protein
MSAEKRSLFARRIARNAMVVIAATAIFGFKAAERSAAAAPAPIAVASR